MSEEQEGKKVDREYSEHDFRIPLSKRGNSESNGEKGERKIANGRNMKIMCMILMRIEDTTKFVPNLLLWV